MICDCDPILGEECLTCEGKGHLCDACGGPTHETADGLCSECRSDDDLCEQCGAPAEACTCPL